MRSVISLFSRLFARPRRHNRVILIFNRMVDAIHLKFWSFTLAVLGNRARARPIQWRGCRIPAKRTAGDRAFSSNTANKISLSPFLRFFSFIHCPIFTSLIGYALGNPHFGSNFGTSSDHPQKYFLNATSSQSHVKSQSHVFSFPF